MTYLTFVPTALFGLAILGGFFFGMRRGLFRSLWHCLFHAIRIVLSLMLTNLLGEKALTWLFDQVELWTAGTAASTLFSDPALEKLIMIPVQMLASLLLFFLLMLVLGLLLKPFEVLFAKILHLPKGRMKWLGGVVGMASGFLILTALSAPLTGVLHITDTMAQTLVTMEEQQNTPPVTPATALTVQKTQTAKDINVMSLLSDIDHSIALEGSRKLGGQYLFDRLTTVEYEGKPITLQHEAEDFAKLIYCGMVLSETAPESWTQKQINAVHDLADAFNDSDLLPQFTVVLFASAQREWDEGNTFLGIAKPQVDEILQPTLDLIIRTFATTSPDDLEHSVTTLANVMDVLYRHDAFTALAGSEDAQDTAIDLLMTENLRNELLQQLQGDHNFCVCVPEIFRVSIRVAEKNLGIENSDQIMGGLANALNNANTATTTEEKVDVLKTEILALSQEHNLELPPEAAEMVSNFLVAEFEEHPEVTKEDLDEWLDTYSEEVLQNGLPENVQAWMENAGMTVPEGLKPENINPDNLPEGVNPSDYLPQ